MVLRFPSALVAACLVAGFPVLAQPSGGPEAYDVPLAPIHGVPLDRSLPRLVSEGWQIVGISLRDRTFAYHLVRDRLLVLCLSEVGRQPPGTECMQIADGPTPPPGGEAAPPRRP